MKTKTTIKHNVRHHVYLLLAALLDGIFDRRTDTRQLIQPTNKTIPSKITSKLNERTENCLPHDKYLQCQQFEDALAHTIINKRVQLYGIGEISTIKSNELHCMCKANFCYEPLRTFIMRPAHSTVSWSLFNRSVVRNCIGYRVLKYVLNLCPFLQF